MQQFKSMDVGVIALSVEPLEKAREMAEKHHAEFPVVYGLSLPQDADRIGAWFDEKRPMIQPSDFILDASDTIVSATYSTGPIGRLLADDAIGMIKFLSSQKK